MGERMLTDMRFSYRGDENVLELDNDYDTSCYNTKY